MWGRVNGHGVLGGNSLNAEANGRLDVHRNSTTNDSNDLKNQRLEVILLLPHL
jgi:hypothetical protein